jgi:hypothetical protein
MDEDRSDILKMMEILTDGVEIAPSIPNEPVQLVDSSVPTSRLGKKMIAGHFDPSVSKQLKQLALERDSTVQALLAEAINDLFVKYGKLPVP